MKRDFHVVIAGAGLAGLAAAALLERARNGERLRLTIVDAAARPGPPPAEVDLRVSAIATGSVDILESAGAWQRLAPERACAYDAMRVWDESMRPESAAALAFDAAEFAVAHLGYIVENSRLREALFEALSGASIDWLFDSPVRNIEPGTDGVRLEVGPDGQVARQLTADLVIGADGANSAVRDLAGIGSRDWPYGQVAFVTHLMPERPHRHRALQRFLGNGPLGMLPLADGRISVVWSTTAAEAQAAMDAGEAELGRMLTAASDGVLGALEPAGPRGTFALRGRHADEYVLPGVALIGDAAHAVHPLAGQGANLGFQDALCLAGVIDAAIGNREYPGDRPVLRRYERERRGANAAMLHFLTALNRLFASNLAPMRAVRRTGMQLFNRSGPLREYVVGVALGAGH